MLFEACVLKKVLLAQGKVHTVRMRLLFTMASLICALRFQPFAARAKKQNGPRAIFRPSGEAKMASGHF